MALGEWTLIRAGMAHQRRRFAPALGIVPSVAVIPHFDEFGEGWVPSVTHRQPGAILLGLDARTAASWHAGSGWRTDGVGRVIVIDGDARREHVAGRRFRGLPRPSA